MADQPTFSGRRVLEPPVSDPIVPSEASGKWYRQTPAEASSLFDRLVDVMADPRNMWMGGPGKFVHAPQAAEQAATALGGVGVGMLAGRKGLENLAASNKVGNASLDDLMNAIKAKEAGLPDLDIYNKYKHFPWYDNKQLWEIPDQHAELKVGGHKGLVDTGEIVWGPARGGSGQKSVQQRMLAMPNRTIIGQPVWDDIMHHPALSDAYPAMGKIQVGKLEPDSYADARVRHLGHNVSDTLIESKAFPENQLRDFLLHEGQHVVQGIEKHPRGGNLDAYLPPGFFEHNHTNREGLNNILSDLWARGIRTNHKAVFDALKEIRANRKPAEGDYATLMAFKRDAGPLGQVYLDRLADKIELDRARHEAWVKYHSHAGEVGARITEGRSDYTPAQRAAKSPSDMIPPGYALDKNRAIIEYDESPLQQK